MKELCDEDLILYFYGEGKVEEIRARLAGSAELRARYEALCRTLELAGEGLPVPARPDSYGAEVWSRLQPFLAGGDHRRILPFPSRTAGRKPEDGRRGMWAGLAAAAVLLLTVGFLAGRFWPRPGEPRTVANAANIAPAANTAEGPLPAAARQRILVSAVAAHLERSERLLTEMANAKAEGSLDVSAERQWARDLLAANRLYRQSTRQGGRPQLTSLLDELEPFLLELSHGPSEVPAGELADFRARLAERTLLFKMRIVSQRLERTTL
jgi:hypothetical protein